MFLNIIFQAPIDETKQGSITGIAWNKTKYIGTPLMLVSRTFRFRKSKFLFFWVQKDITREVLGFEIRAWSVVEILPVVRNKLD